MIAFDLDGTLIDCRRRQVDLAVFLAARRETGPIDPAAFWAAKRDGASTREALLAQKLAADVAAEIAAEWTGRVEDPEWLRLDAAHDRVMAILGNAAGRGGTMILTARRDEAALRNQLASFPVPPATAVRCVPPARAAAEKARVLSESAATLFIGDTESDLRAAREANLPFLAVAWGQRSPEFLHRAGADVVALDPHDIEIFLTGHRD